MSGRARRGRPRQLFTFFFLSLLLHILFLHAFIETEQKWICNDRFENRNALFEKNSEIRKTFVKKEGFFSYDRE